MNAPYEDEYTEDGDLYCDICHSENCHHIPRDPWWEPEPDPPTN